MGIMGSSAARNRSFGKSALYSFIICLALAITGVSNAVAANRLVDVKYHTIVDHQLELQLIFEDDIAKPEIELNASPAQIILFFKDSISGLEKNQLPIKAVGVESVSVSQDGGSTRLVVSLDKVKAYKGNLAGNTYNLTINDEVAESKDSAENPFVNSINNIDFRRTEEGGGELLVKLNNSKVAANVEQVGAKLELKLYNTDIESDLLYVMDVQDFATPVRSFETYKDELTSRFLIDITGEYDYSYVQEGNVFRLSITKAERVFLAKEEAKYDGKSLSLNFQSISVRTVLQIIADYNNFNLVTSDTVEGDITLRLDDVPWDQALDLILQTKGLDKRIEGNILMVAPREELAIRESQMLKDMQEVKELSPLY